MRSQIIDPRDVSWEMNRPVYRVYFWWQLHRGPDVMWQCEEHRLQDAADVEEVLRWARGRAGVRDFVLYAETSDGAALGLLRLAGYDANAASSGDCSQAASASG